jgi:phosphoglycerate dehydrogenase-like enzyme
VQLLSAGYDEMDMGLAREYGIPVALNGGANAASVAEHIVLMILASYRHLVELATLVRQGVWESSFSTSKLAYEVEGKIVGLVGMGSIGRAVALRLGGFGAKLVYFDVRRLPAPREEELGLTYWSMADLLSRADIISLQVPLLPETRHLIGERELSMMKKTALLVNTARGALVDEAALERALADHSILGAALDVLGEEPPRRDHPLLALDNCLITPHCAGPTWDSWPKRFRNGFANIERVLRGETPQWLVA